MSGSIYEKNGEHSSKRYRAFLISVQPNTFLVCDYFFFAEVFCLIFLRKIQWRAQYFTATPDFLTTTQTYFFKSVNFSFK